MNATRPPVSEEEVPRWRVWVIALWTLLCMTIGFVCGFIVAVMVGILT